MRIIKFITSNILYLIWFILYFVIAWDVIFGIPNGFGLTLAIYTVSITIALSPIGEQILRIIENCRLPRTQQEKQYLIPIFQEVFEHAKDVNPKLKEDIQLYISDVMHVDSFAVGRKTIVITKGAVETFTADELKGILAHELGHITYGHSKVILLTQIGNIFFIGIVWFFRVILYIIQFISDEIFYRYFIGKVFSVLTFLTRIATEVVVFLFITLGEIILALNSRAHDIQADTFAFEAGYGKELISGLYLLQKISITGKATILERVKASHPHLAVRIEHIEELADDTMEM